VAVDQPHRLEQRGADDRSDEREAAPPQVGRQRDAIAEGKEVRPERAVRLAQCDEPTGIPDRRADLGPIAHDARIGEQPPLGGRGEPRDAVRVEAGERPAIPLPLAQDRGPGESRLSALEHQEFEERSVIAAGAAPFAVVIAAKRGTPERPGADRHLRTIGWPVEMR